MSIDGRSVGDSVGRFDSVPNAAWRVRGDRQVWPEVHRRVRRGGCGGLVRPLWGRHVFVGARGVRARGAISAARQCECMGPRASGAVCWRRRRPRWLARRTGAGPSMR